MSEERRVLLHCKLCGKPRTTLVCACSKQRELTEQQERAAKRLNRQATAASQKEMYRSHYKKRYIVFGAWIRGDGISAWQMRQTHPSSEHEYYISARHVADCYQVDHDHCIFVDYKEAHRRTPFGMPESAWGLSKQEYDQLIRLMPDPTNVYILPKAAYRNLEPGPDDRLSTEVIGYRSWRVHYNNAQLYSMGAHNLWVPGINTAECRINSYYVNHFKPRAYSNNLHAAPNMNCDCGLYALHESRPYSSLANRSYEGTYIISGAVRAWGRILVHGAGFRAEKMQIIALIHDTHDSEFIRLRNKDLAYEHRVPLVPYNQLKSIASEFGNPFPEDMIPRRWT